MSGVLNGFLVIAVMVAVGYLVRRFDLLDAGADAMLSRLVIFVMMPCLLLTVLIRSDVRQVLSLQLVIALVAALAGIGLFALVARLAWRRPAPQVVIGSMAAGMSNAGNIGIPVSLYVLGSAVYPAPVILLQSALIVPAAIAVLDVLTADARMSARRAVLQPLRSPVLIATVVGILISVLRIPVPKVVLDPFELIGNASVPVVLIAFGMSLASTRPLVKGSGRRDVLLAVAIKLTFMPLVAWSLARFVFRMDAQEVLVVTVLAALPTAQNVFAVARRYGRGETVARDSGLIATVASIPVLLVITALLAP